MIIPDDIRVYIKAFPGEFQSDQSIINGRQNNLTHSKHKVVRSFIRLLSKEIDDRLSNWKFQGIWSTTMYEGGFHIQHTHPKGWMSGVFYIQVPDNSANLLLDGQLLFPEVGKGFLFPSNLLHGTTEHKNSIPRISIAFDLFQK